MGTHSRPSWRSARTAGRESVPIRPSYCWFLRSIAKVSLASSSALVGYWFHWLDHVVRSGGTMAWVLTYSVSRVLYRSTCLHGECFYCEKNKWTGPPPHIGPIPSALSHTPPPPPSTRPQIIARQRQGRVCMPELLHSFSSSVFAIPWCGVHAASCGRDSDWRSPVPAVARCRLEIRPAGARFGINHGRDEERIDGRSSFGGGIQACGSGGGTHPCHPCQPRNGGFHLTLTGIDEVLSSLVHLDPNAVVGC